MRLQVFLSHSGICSRRKALDLVKSGRVKVNNAVVREPSFQVDSSRDKIHFDGKQVELKENIYILFNKPEGVTTTKKDNFAEKTVFDILPKKFQHLNPVGRLDKDSSGLLILTNDGDLTYKLTHPSFETGKTYEVKLDNELRLCDKSKIEKGVELEDGLTSPCKIEAAKGLVRITIHEGKKRQVRRMFAALNYNVVKLRRIQEGSLDLGNLKLGAWRPLNADEVCRLQR